MKRFSFLHPISHLSFLYSISGMRASATVRYKLYSSFNKIMTSPAPLVMCSSVGNDFNMHVYLVIDHANFDTQLTLFMGNFEHHVIILL